MFVILSTVKNGSSQGLSTKEIKTVHLQSFFLLQWEDDVDNLTRAGAAIFIFIGVSCIKKVMSMKVSTEISYMLRIACYVSVILTRLLQSCIAPGRNAYPTVVKDQVAE